jgi:hypothetical protein
MSMSPNNPFDKNSPSNSEHHPPNSEHHPPEQKPANAKSRNGCLIAVVVVLLLSVLVCCGGGVALYYFGSEAISELVRSEVENDPAILEHIGEIESFELDISDTAAAGQAAEQPGDPSPLAFQIQGSKGEGQLLVMPDDTQNGFGSATLILSDGRRIPVDMMGVTEDIDLDMDLDVGDLFDEGDATLGAEATPVESDASDSDQADSSAEEASEKPAE